MIKLLKPLKHFSDTFCKKKGEMFAVYQDYFLTWKHVWYCHDLLKFLGKFWFICPNFVMEYNFNGYESKTEVNNCKFLMTLIEGEKKLVVSSCWENDAISKTVNKLEDREK